MPTPATPTAPRTNRLGLTVVEYRGGKTTLCAGCGHNAISERILEAMFDMGVSPERVVKLSGIGCSSKSPAYFMTRSHAFNALHGRMPSVATGAALANRQLLASASPGTGTPPRSASASSSTSCAGTCPSCTSSRTTACSGLTKGQFSATADLGAKLKTGVQNDLPAIDLCTLAVQLGATFVGRSFSGDKRQLSAMLKAALAHRGTAMLDVVSPCVTFNDHEGSTKSYAYMKEHDVPLHELQFVPAFEDIAVEYDPGTTVEVTMHDGSHLRLRKLEEGYDPRDRARATTRLMEAQAGGDVLTGVLFVDARAPSFVDPEPRGCAARDLPEARAAAAGVLDALMDGLR
jgi:2-oxoglutarate ferredoxin oxidoreductase subunit beta